MGQISADAHQVAFIMTTTAVASLHKSLRSSHIANLQIELQAPTQKQRHKVSGFKYSLSVDTSYLLQRFLLL